MKKVPIILILLISIPVILNAQKLRFSFVANPQINWLSTDKNEISSAGSLLGINTGIKMDIFFSENYAFSTGLTLNSLGGSLSYQDSISISSAGAEYMTELVKYQNQYLSIPFGLKFKTVEIGYTTIWLNPGISTMFKLKAQGSFEDEDEKRNISEEIGLLNINYFLEAGVEYSLGGNTAIIAGLGYYSGIMDITNHADDKITSGSVALVLGLLF